MKVQLPAQQDTCDDDALAQSLAITLKALFGDATRSPAALLRGGDEARADACAAMLPAPPATMLHTLKPRLNAALTELRAVRPALDLEKLGDRIAAFFAVEPIPATRAWNAAATVLQLQALQRSKMRLVVYTVLVGAKESLADPLAALPAAATTDLDLDFVCLTDNPGLRSDIWRIVTIPGGHLPPEKLSRRPKALPHDYFLDVEFSLYIDNTVTFKRLPQASDLATDRPYLFKAFRHATRTNPEQEAAAVAMLGYDDVDTICRQMAFYAKRGPLAEITPLTTATVLLRQHHRPEIRRFGTTWWESILAFSKRDQLSFDFARQLAGCELEFFDGATHANDWLTWQGGLSQHRVKASFDDQRYAWQHRDDSEAQADPRGHFLRHHTGSDAAFQKPSPLLEFVCQMQGSSLGRHVSPRRGIAEPLETLLAPLRRAGRRWLLVRVQDNPVPHAFSTEEHDAAAKALSMYMNPAQGTLIDLTTAGLVADGKVYVTSEAGYDAVLVLGAVAAQMQVLLPKLQRLINVERGLVVFVLATSATLEEAARAESWLAHQFQAHTGAQLHGSLHDDEQGPLANTVLALTWQVAVDCALPTPLMPLISAPN